MTKATGNVSVYSCGDYVVYLQRTASVHSFYLLTITLRVIAIVDLSALYLKLLCASKLYQQVLYFVFLFQAVSTSG